MNEVKMPKKALIFYYVLVLLILLLFNFLAVVLSGLVLAAPTRCWTLLPIKLPRGGVFRLVLGSSAAVLNFAAHLNQTR